jgi:hypothetical protein
VRHWAQRALDWAWRSPWHERRLLGHDGAVSAVAFSPDGKLVLTGSYDKTARLWEAAGGKLSATLSGHEASVNGVALSLGVGCLRRTMPLRWATYVPGSPPEHSRSRGRVDLRRPSTSPR